MYAIADARLATTWFSLADAQLAPFGVNAFYPYIFPADFTGELTPEPHTGGEI
jgi:hypothetical protein